MTANTPAIAVGGEAIDVRRFDVRMAVGTEVAPAKIIGEDHDDVWGGTGGRRVTE